MKQVEKEACLNFSRKNGCQSPKGKLCPKARSSGLWLNDGFNHLICQLTGEELKGGGKNFEEDALPRYKQSF